LAEAEERHSGFWEAKLRAAGQLLPSFKLNWRMRTLIFLARRFGPAFVLPNIEPLEQIDSHKYDLQPEALAGGLPQQEQSHARLLRAITGGSPTGLEGSRIAQLEGRHRAIGGNALRAAVLGANDGLLSNFSLVMGVAGADLSGKSVLITGVAGLLAGACSMAIGEWLSVQSARELYQSQIEVEKQEVDEVPDEEAEELALIYQAKGLPEDEAQKLAKRLITDKASALDTMAREELGIDPKELGGSAGAAAGASFCLFALGAIIPVAPFFFLSGLVGVIVSICCAIVALFGIGAGITLLTGRNVFYSGTRQVILGLLAAGITFGLGRVIGASLAG
jgi:vacuolar iron transporter family protein